MKSFTIASIVALATVATAQLDGIPSCALNCFLAPLTSDGCSSLTDFACHCKKGAALIAQVQPCVQSACSASDQAAALTAVESTCKSAGVPIDLPDASGAASTPVATATSVAAPASTAVASSAAASSAAPMVSTTVASAASSAMSMSSMTASMTATPSSNSTVSVTPSVSQFTGGAAQATQAVGILGAAALAMLAL